MYYLSILCSCQNARNRLWACLWNRNNLRYKCWTKTTVYSVSCLTCSTIQPWHKKLCIQTWISIPVRSFLAENLSKKFGTQINDLWENFGSDFNYPANLPEYVEEYFKEQENSRLMGSDSPPGRVQCLPLPGAWTNQFLAASCDESDQWPWNGFTFPGPFLPCHDLFDWWTLRCGVWIVFLLAMLGNGTVVFVLVFSRSKMDVPRFLVCNLAAADFFMGVYLGTTTFLSCK